MSYNATTIDGDEVRIAAKVGSPSGEILVSEDGTEYVVDGQGLLVALDPPKPAEEAEAEEEDAEAEDE